ncbi:MAG: hypothetical protein ACREX5_09375 [Achromobacter pestifer]
MNKNQEKVLVATLCGLVIAVAGAVAVQPAMAAGYSVDPSGRATDVALGGQVNLRKEPGAYSRWSAVPAALEPKAAETFV